MKWTGIEKEGIDSMSKSILLVDGENMVMRFQDMMANGYQPFENVVHQTDCFVWNPRMNHPVSSFDRVCYYTSVAGDDVKMRFVEESISKIIIGSVPAIISPIPFVFKRPKDSRKLKMVDIQIVIDALKYASTDVYDEMWIASGDGDYIPLMRELRYLGRRVGCMALSSGINVGIRQNVDRFINLDDHFFPNASEIRKGLDRSP